MCWLPVLTWAVLRKITLKSLCANQKFRDGATETMQRWDGVAGVFRTFLVGVTKSDFREGLFGSDYGGRSSLAMVAEALALSSQLRGSEHGKDIASLSWLPLFFCSV